MSVNALDGVNAIGSTDDGAWDGSAANASVVSLLKAQVAGLDPGGTAGDPITGSFSAAGQSSSFYPLAGRGADIFFKTTNFVGTVQLERSDNGTDWYIITVIGTQLYLWSFGGTATLFSENFEEPSPRVHYRLNCTSYTSGTLNYEVFQ